MDLITSMRVFTVIASEHSFRAAADMLVMPPSAISKHLAGLESRLGAQLVERTTRRVSLTEVGADYLVRCRHILSEIDEAEAEITDATGEVKGVLKVSSPPAFAHRHIAPHIPYFLKKYPKLSIDLSTTDYSISPSHTAIDLHIRISEMNTTDGLTTIMLAPNTRRLVASSDYIKENGAPITVSDLQKHRLLTLEYGHPHNNWHFRTESGNMNAFLANGSVRMDSGDAILRAVLNNGGISMLPTYVTGKHIHNKHLVPLLDELVSEDEPIHATFRSKNHRYKRIMLLTTFLQGLYSPTPYWDQHDGTSEAALRAAL
ncbi:LysR family transcriptional regulator [Alphaproteobacteria bacterium]|nr:LysR family transcriptional regulator [Alphaproteobacteria bacterium]MDA9189946.1 LysR family transcriptional regulator [Alphaproteobacteria bacterium]